MTNHLMNITKFSASFCKISKAVFAKKNAKTAFLFKNMLDKTRIFNYYIKGFEILLHI